jgi:hypothetical protein
MHLDLNIYSHYAIIKVFSSLFIIDGKATII